MLEPAELLVTANPKSWQREMYHDLPTQGGQQWYEFTRPTIRTTAVMLSALHGFKLRSLPPVSSLRAHMLRLKSSRRAALDRRCRQRYRARPLLLATLSSPALLALLPPPAVRTYAGAPALLALAPLPAVRAYAGAPALLVLAPLRSVRAEGTATVLTTLTLCQWVVTGAGGVCQDLSTEGTTL